MLDKLDKELETRELRFVRYADDVVIYVKSRKSAKRVLESITRFIEDKLKLKVNREKSKIDRPWKMKFLGFSFYQKRKGIGIRVHNKSIAKFKVKLKEITGRSKSMNIAVRLKKLKRIVIGWLNYYKIADMRNIMLQIDQWLRRRVRMVIWKQWKKIKTRFKKSKKTRNR